MEVVKITRIQFIEGDIKESKEKEMELMILQTLLLHSSICFIH